MWISWKWHEYSGRERERGKEREKERKRENYQGNRTDQFRNIAANTNSVTSVTVELPFWKKMPAIAGNNASPSGVECQCDSSRGTSWFDTRGRNKSSVEDRIELRASDIESESVEFRRSSPSTWDERRFKGVIGDASAIFDYLQAESVWGKNHKRNRFVRA